MENNNEIQIQFVPIELLEHYCDVIINRWETLTGHKAVKIG